MSVTGVDKVVAALQAQRARAVKAVAAGLYGAGSNIMTEAKGEAPVAEVAGGTLRGSGYVTLPRGLDTEHPTVEIGFGGAASDYTIPQHERTDYRHTTGKAGYLRDPVNAASGSFAQSVATIARAAFQTGGEPTLPPSNHATAPSSAAPPRKGSKRERSLRQRLASYKRGRAYAASMRELRAKAGSL